MLLFLASQPVPFGEALLIALGIGLLVALIVTLIMKGQLRSVRFKHSASDYVRSGSLRLTQSHDLYLYRNVTRTPRPKNNSSHGPHGGHGGRGGRF